MQEALRILEEKNNIDVTELKKNLEDLNKNYIDCIQDSENKTTQIEDLNTQIQNQMQHIRNVIRDGNARAQQLEQELIDKNIELEISELDGIVQRELGELVRGMSIMYRKAQLSDNRVQKFVIRATILSLKNYDPDDREKYVQIIEKIADVDGIDAKKNGRKVIAEIESIRDLNIYEKMLKFFYL